MKMNFSELRIGNVVSSVLHKGQLTEIYAIFHSHVKLGANPLALYKYKEIKPVRLTKTVLVKMCGFVKAKDDIGWEDDTYPCWELGNFKIVLSDGCLFLWEECADPFYSRPTKRIKYLHDLQNIYYYQNNKKELKTELYG